MIRAPRSPSTRELHKAYPVSRKTSLSIANTRIAVNHAIAHPNNRLLLTGPCAMVNRPKELSREQGEWVKFAATNGLVAVMRLHPWKPRSVEGRAAKQQQWHGLETGSQDGTQTRKQAAAAAFAIMHNGAVEYGNVSTEVAFQSHVRRYGPLLAFAQVGARTHDQYYETPGGYHRFLDSLAREEPTLPVGIKNDTDGSIERALEDVDRINEIRIGLGMSAASRAVLIYRGGTNVRTADAWQAGAAEAIERTRGAAILDMAHGGEQACNPTGYDKSPEGQLICWDRSIELRESGYICVGNSTESSNIARLPMDPAAKMEEVMQRAADIALQRAA